MITRTFASRNRQHRLYVAQVAPGVGVFVPIFCPTRGALACICHGSCDKCPWVPGGRPLGMAADTRIICPYFLVFTVKLAIFLVFTVLEKNTV